MKSFLKLFFISLLVVQSSGTFAVTAKTSPFNLLIAPGTLTDQSATLLWDKQSEINNAVYEILLGGKIVGSTDKTNFTLTKLRPGAQYKVQLQLKGQPRAAKKNVLSFRTALKGKMYNVLDYGAKGDGRFKNTKAIQSAIDACTPGGTVYIPEGTFLSGALFLKSNMTLYIASGAVLKGSGLLEDYLPMTYNRFEGWEMKTYASLINAGTLNRDGSYNVHNLGITGKGMIMGGGSKLGKAMIAASGIRSRGRLICLMNCQDVSISGLTVTAPPAWTIHYIYSDNVTCHDLTINTVGVANGDGIDPDSSTDSYIFNCTFSTGDDCIAIKSGKNPEGFTIGKPTRNVRITNCNFIKGHGISIGSEMSGGVSDVLVQDCKAAALLHGMQIKGTKERGGYVENVMVAHCQLMQVTIYSAVNYNNDGAAAPQIPTFKNFVFSDLDLSAADSKEPVIDINGFKDPGHRLQNVLFKDISLPDNAKIMIKNAENVKFINIRSSADNKPNYNINNSKNIHY
ncbi:MAG TPA: glycoside hydrolase family 28 protein [Arachidicoccus sp.]|nr:glycoside hydrolase family 28 protein [Arachidicoccus sp.]